MTPDEEIVNVPECPMCDGTGYKDCAALKMEPCDHIEHVLALVEPDALCMALAEIRIIIGVGEKPMLSDLPDAVREALVKARVAGAASMQIAASEGWDEGEDYTWDAPDIAAAILDIDPKGV